MKNEHPLETALRALRVVRTWAAFDVERDEAIALDAKGVLDYIDKALAKIKAALEGKA